MEPMHQRQLKDALIEVALLESKSLAVGLAEIIAYLQEKEHLAATGAFLALEQQFTFLGTVLGASTKLAPR